MARRSSGDDLYDFARLLGQNLPLWAVALVAAVIGIGGFLLVQMLLGYFSSFLGDLGVRLPLIAGELGFLLVLAGGTAGSSERRSRQRLVENTHSTGDLSALSWRQLEKLTAELYRQQGHTVIERGGAKADGGVDVEVFTASGESWLVQCKQWKSSRVGVKTVREMLGVLSKQGADKVVVITSGSFTPDALAFAQGQPIELIDGKRFARKLQSVQATEEAPPDSTTSDSRSCPHCGAPLVSRIARRGKHQGQSFWGCKTYPQCRYIEN